MTTLAFETLSRTNLARCTGNWQMPLSAWSRADWLIAIGGELGEALNVVKKLNRDAGGWAGNSVPREALQAALADELADVVIYLDLYVSSLGQTLSAATPWSDFDELRKHVAGVMDTREGLSVRGRLCLIAMGDFSAGTRRDEFLQHLPRLLIRLDVLALEAEIDLGAAVIAKFNRTSQKLGFDDRLVEG